MKIKWTKLFDWSVSGVYRYVLPNKAGYGVDVLYRHHGLRQVRFHVKRDAILAERKLAALEADAYFFKMYAKMNVR